MVRIIRAALLAVVLLAALAVPANAATWSSVSGLIAGDVTSAATDGPRVLVTSLTGNRTVVLTTIARDRVARRQTLAVARRRGIVSNLQVARLRGGRALAVWREGLTVRASLRPSPGSRFRSARTVSRFPAGGGIALAPDLGVTSAGEPVVAWWGGPASGTLGIYASAMAPSGTWAAAVEISAGTYPPLGPPGGPLLGIDIAADQAGGLGVAWRQPGGGAEEIMGVLRSPAGAWGTPARLGGGRIGFGAPAAIAPSAGELVAVWSEWRGAPGGPAARGCAVAGTVRGGLVATDDVVCRDGAFAGRVRAARTPRGGAVVAAEFGSASFGGSGSVVEVASRDAAGTWSPSRLALSQVGAFDSAVPGTGGRTAVPAVVGRSGQWNRVRVALVGPDGAVLRRIEGPARPTPPRNQTVGVVPLGPGARVAMLLTPVPALSSERASILTLG